MSNDSTALAHFTARYGNGYHLIGLTGEEITHYDGPHDTAEDVAKAQLLHQKIACLRDTQPDVWKMVVVMDVPLYNGQVNESAVAELNRAYRVAAATNGVK